MDTTSSEWSQTAPQDKVQLYGELSKGNRKQGRSLKRTIKLQRQRESKLYPSLNPLKTAQGQCTRSGWLDADQTSTILL